MSEMIDRMAKAMQASKTWPAVFQAGTARELVLAALEALEEPTTEMVRFGEDAGRRAVGLGWSQLDGRNFADAAFRAMIERARTG